MTVILLDSRLEKTTKVALKVSAEAIMKIIEMISKNQMALKLKMLRHSHLHGVKEVISSTSPMRSINYNEVYCFSVCASTSQTYCSRATDADRKVLAKALQGCKFLLETNCKYVRCSFLFLNWNKIPSYLMLLAFNIIYPNSPCRPMVWFTIFIFRYIMRYFCNCVGFFIRGYHQWIRSPVI